MEPELMGLREAADYLQVSQTRIQQMVREKKIAVVAVGARQSAYAREELDRYRMARSGAMITPVAALLEPAPAPLARIQDTIVTFDDGHWLGPNPRAHLRIWEGACAEGWRRVVALGPLGRESSPVMSQWELIAPVVDRQFLSGQGGAAIWFIVEPLRETGSMFLATNVVMADRRAPFADRVSKLFAWASRGNDRAEIEARPFGPAEWRRSGIAEVERLIGGPVEVYPDAAYTEDTIHRWQRARRTVDVVADTPGFGRITAGIRTLRAIPVDSRRHDLARRVAGVLADEIAALEPLVTVGPWRDGITPRDPARGDWPTTFAARLVPPTLTESDRAMLAEFTVSHDWPWTQEHQADRKDVLGLMRRWRDDVDEYADPATRNPDIYSALTSAIGSVQHWLRTDAYTQAVRRRTGGENPQDIRGAAIEGFDAVDEVDEDYWPRAVPRLLRAIGDRDRQYLATVQWETARTQVTRTHRQLRDRIPSDLQQDIRFGYDSFGRLVAHAAEYPPASGALFAVLWPHEAPRLGLPGDAELVADGEVGDRPVYIRYPDGRMDLLPISPHDHNQWNFGYMGGGPGALAHSINRAMALCAGVPLNQIPQRWIEDFLERTDEDHLRLPITQILQRIPARQPS